MHFKNFPNFKPVGVLVISHFLLRKKFEIIFIIAFQR